MNVTAANKCLASRKRQSDSLYFLASGQPKIFNWRYVALVVVLWCPALSASSSVTALSDENQ